MGATSQHRPVPLVLRQPPMKITAHGCCMFEAPCLNAALISCTQRCSSRKLAPYPPTHSQPLLFRYTPDRPLQRTWHNVTAIPRLTSIPSAPCPSSFGTGAPAILANCNGQPLRPSTAQHSCCCTEFCAERGSRSAHRERGWS